MDAQSQEDASRVAKAFVSADGDRSGSLDASELASFMTSLGTKVTTAQSDELVKKADLDRSGKLNLDEVTKLFSVAKLRAVFDEIDEDHSGSIQASELSAALKKLGYVIPEGHCRQLLGEIDIDKSGRVSFDEFTQFFRYVPMASLAAVADHLMAHVALDVGTDLAPPLPGKDLPVWECLLVGGAAGICSRTLTAPLERVKILAQVGELRCSGGALAELRRIAAAEGATGLWRGNGANCVRVFPFAGIVMLTYTRLVKALPSDDELDPLEPAWRALAGGAAGVAGTLATYPIDVVRARLTVGGANGQQRHGGGLLRCLVAVAREPAGLRGLYAGVVPTLCAVGPFVAIQQATYDVLKRAALDADAASSVPLFLGCSAAAGAVAQSVVYPLDLIRRRMQLSGGGAATAATTAAAGASAARAAVSDFTWLAGLRQIIATKGPRGAFAGIGPTYAKVLPSVMIAKSVADSLVAFGDKRGWRGRS